MKTRILYVHHGIGLGGAPLSLLYLVRQLDRERYEPIILCLHDSEAARLFRKQGWRTIAGIGPKHFPHSAMNHHPWYRPDRILRGLLDQVRTVLWTAPRLLRTIQPQIIHLNSPSLLGWGIAGKIRRVPVVCHLREPVADGYFGIRRAMMRSLTQWFTSAFIAICRYDASTLKSSDKVHVVFNSVDFEEFNRSLDGRSIRAELGIAPERRMILYLGGFNPRKGLQVLLAGAERFMDETCSLIIAGYTDQGRSDWKVLLRRRLARIGLSSSQERMKKQIADLRKQFSEQSILMVGFRRDVPQLMATSDLVVFPATVPHFARPVFEAAAMAKPVVASAIGGIPELVEDGRTGILVPADSPALFGDAVHRILSSPEDRRAMGEHAFKRAREMFDAESNAKAIERIYEDSRAENLDR